MPYRTTGFTEDAYYHVFNRGVEKRTIFLDEQDYFTFLDILTYYLKFLKKIPKIALTRTGLVNSGRFQNEIKLVAFCLMPNHFHLLLHQQKKNSISEFIRRIATTYSMYFNKRYQRVGALFQGRFKAKHLDTESYLLQATKYLHKNPIDLVTRTGLVNYPWSSYQTYLKNTSKDLHQINSLIHHQPILDYFSKSNFQLSYQSFVEETPLSDPYRQELKWLA